MISHISFSFSWNYTGNFHRYIWDRTRSKTGNDFPISAFARVHGIPNYNRISGDLHRAGVNLHTKYWSFRKKNNMPWRDTIRVSATILQTKRVANSEGQHLPLWVHWRRHFLMAWSDMIWGQIFHSMCIIMMSKWPCIICCCADVFRHHRKIWKQSPLPGRMWEIVSTASPLVTYLQ